MKKFWLIKTEPDNDWSWSDQLKKNIECWDGVRNYAARKNLQSMKKNDLAFFYHSGKDKCIMGIVKIVKEAYPDPSDKSGKFVMVDVKSFKSFTVPITLTKIKTIKALDRMVLVNNSRLSVQPVKKSEWEIICKLGQ
ncbi:MAG: hypothetical protein CFH01_00379 [Alphaproteobacteria bacterium MarineAlpha2_Bin1]|nr:MAG: hypothetical protein CFH01_00379 [Alphaproteobacteria bacterium MarineAlpha2_Bin1]|tara:strand:- start:249 stop:659 length:411 start_codon:yes stop_codon:yes gene_type:complete